jgi:predicted negative regulator of RcsB-dependent stress response
VLSAYTEQEELEKLKAWWKNYGPALLIGVVIGVALLFGNKYWKEHKERQREEASGLYEQVLDAQRRGDAQAVRSAGAKLVQDYDATPYASMAALAVARAAAEAGDLAGARAQLEWVLAHGHDAAVQHAARLRLGRVLLAMGEVDRVLALVAEKDPAGFRSEYLELKGDALLSAGRRDEALAAYQDALKHARPGAGAAMLNVKLDDLAAAAKAP